MKKNIMRILKKCLLLSMAVLMLSGISLTLPMPEGMGSVKILGAARHIGYKRYQSLLAM